jgi:ribosome-associated protein
VIEITPVIQIDEDELEFSFIRSSGPGGQNVNKVSTAVQLRFNVTESPSLPQEVKLRLVRLAGKRLSSEGILIIEARQFRSQEQNRQAALDRLVRLVRQAAEPPLRRRKTRPTQASILRRLASKRKRGERKRLRGDSGVID